MGGFFPIFHSHFLAKKIFIDGLLGKLGTGCSGKESSSSAMEEESESYLDVFTAASIHSCLPRTLRGVATHLFLMDYQAMPTASIPKPATK